MFTYFKGVIKILATESYSTTKNTIIIRIYKNNTVVNCLEVSVKAKIFF